MTMTVHPPSFVSEPRELRPRTSQPTTPARRPIPVALAAAISLALILVMLVIDGDAAADVRSEVPASIDSITVYVVQPGDSLWGIAQSLAGPDDDIRQLVDELKTVAGGADLQIGQQLILDSTTLSHSS